MLGDVNGDGMADIIGFACAHVVVAFSNKTSFLPQVNGIYDFTNCTKGWGTFSVEPRFVADVNGDGRADIVGYGNAGEYVALSTADIILF